MNISLVAAFTLGVLATGLVLVAGVVALLFTKRLVLTETSSTPPRSHVRDRVYLRAAINFLAGAAVTQALMRLGVDSTAIMLVASAALIVCLVVESLGLAQKHDGPGT